MAGRDSARISPATMKFTPLDLSSLSLRAASLAIPFGLVSFTLGQEQPGLMFKWEPGSAVETRPRIPDESKAYKSLDVRALSPFADQMGSLGLFSGFYDFNEGVEDSVIPFKNRNEVSFANQAYIQSEYHTNPDLKRENGFLGLWASFPLRSHRERESGLPYDRLRTRREVPVSGTSSMAASSSAGVTPPPASPPPPKGYFHLSSLFKPKPKADLIPTSGKPPVALQAGSTGNTGPGPVPNPLLGNTPAPSPTAEVSPVSTAAPSQDRAPRFLGAPFKTVTEPAATNGERHVRWTEQFFGKVSPAPKKTTNRPPPLFHR
jgi:hypothetical protein